MAAGTKKAFGYIEKAQPTSSSPYSGAAGTEGQQQPEAVETEGLLNILASDTYSRVEQTTFIDVDFSEVAAIGTKLIGPVIPDNAIILGAYMEVITAVVGAGASISMGIETAIDLQAVAAVAGAPWSTTGFKALSALAAQPSAATSFIKCTAARQLTVVTSAAVLTAGRFGVYVKWMPGL
tara:strand:+ start:603 stop:1142 length:540 start_codon:yes stop_codon:yes gene_type:complete